MARKTKLTDKFIQVTQNVVNEGDNAILFTDQELLEEINESLPESEQISKRTFERYIEKNEVPEFCRIIKKARRIQKRNLLTQMKQAKAGDWQKYAWILERKFSDEFNLKKKTEVSGGEKPIKIILDI